jgi:RNA-binding motif X-linked protein 2
MNTIKEILRINEEELKRGLAGTAASWHQQYAQSAWVYVGNLDHALTEGDVICVLSQYGEIEDIHLVREEDTGKSRGFAFCKYEDARSCVLAVDNFTGIELCGRSLRVDHVENYRLPKHLMDKEDQATVPSLDPGHAYQDKELANEYSLDKGHDLFAPPSKEEKPDANAKEAKRERQRERHQKQEEKEQRRRDRERRRSEREDKHRKKRAREISADERRERSSTDNDTHRRRRKNEGTDRDRKSRSPSH